MNLNPAAYFERHRIFMNLASNEWIVAPAGGASSAGYLDADRNPIKVNPGDRVVRIVQAPTDAFRGKSVDIVCRWDGQGTLNAANASIRKNYTSGANWLRYTYVPDPNAEHWFSLELKAVNASDPVRNVDCRETNAKPDAIFDPTFLALVSRYNTVRFMDWQSTNANNALTWANRTTPAMGPVAGKDGYAIEYMVALANQAKTNPWFCISWNADDDYVRRFAELVRDTLDPNLKVYVENSNEVWNFAFPITSQARDEGLAEGLSTDPTFAMMYRYAEKTAHVMDIWRDVFAGQEHRLVRVAASINDNPWVIEQVLSFRDTPAHIDAIASAPYFGVDLSSYADTPAGTASLFAALKQSVDGVIYKATEFKKQATKYNLRFVTYEGGQHIVSSNVAFNKRIQADPRMGQLYTYFMTRWNNDVGDLMVLFSDISSTSQYGAWGAMESISQSTMSTPKSRAITLFLASIGR